MAIKSKQRQGEWPQSLQLVLYCCLCKMRPLAGFPTAAALQTRLMATGQLPCPAIVPFQVVLLVPLRSLDSFPAADGQHCQPPGPAYSLVLHSSARKSLQGCLQGIIRQGVGPSWRRGGVGRVHLCQAITTK